MKYTIALFIGAISAIKLEQKAHFIDFDFPAAGLAEQAEAGAAAALAADTLDTKTKTEDALVKANAAAQAAQEGHAGAESAKSTAVSSALERKGDESERVASDLSAQAAITSEENARRDSNSAAADAATTRHLLDVATWEDDNAQARKAKADQDLNIENERIKFVHRQWEQDMDDDRASQRERQESDNRAWLDYVKSRDHAILEEKQADLANKKFHIALQQKMDAQVEARKALVKSEQDRVAAEALAANRKEAASWDAWHDAVDARLQKEYNENQDARLTAHNVRQKAAFHTDNGEEWAANMPEHVTSDHEFSSNLVQDFHLRQNGESGSTDPAKKLADKLKTDSAIEAVKQA